MGTRTIRQLADQCGVTLRTLRFYEVKGLISPKREGQGRLYSDADVVRLRRILALTRVGFRLCEVREILAHSDRGDDQAADELIRKRVRDLEAETRQRLAAIERLRNEVEA